MSATTMPKAGGLNDWLASAVGQRVVLAFLLFVAIALPIVGKETEMLSNLKIFQVGMMFVYAIAVLGLNLLTGYNGQISLGHGAFLAIGGYCTAIIMKHFGLPFWLAIPLSGLLSFGIGYLFGLPALRLEGHYLALATFALALAIPQLIKHPVLAPWTRGVQGINLPRPKAPFGLPLSSDQWFYFLSLFVAIIMFWLAYNLLHGRVGRAVVAIRNHSLAASTMGIDLAQTKAVVFGISAMFTGIAGSLYAIGNEIVAPDSYRFDVSIALFVGLVVGGVASLLGSAIGGVFVQVIEKYADSIAKGLEHTLNLPIEIAPWTIYGIALILLMYFMPSGVAGGLKKLWAMVSRR